MRIIEARPGDKIILGRKGENLARTIRFSVAEWLRVYGPGTVVLLHQRGSDEAPYPVAVAQNGATAEWVVTSADVAESGTAGRYELHYVIDEQVVKSAIGKAVVASALGKSTETPPAAQRAWVDKVVQAGADAKTAAERAEAAAARAEDTLGGSTWIGFEMDEEGNMYAVLTPESGVRFALDENGYLEVAMNV